ncbi:hypothetical protein T05_6686, partial [Trichinella murrelli]
MLPQNTTSAELLLGMHFDAMVVQHLLHVSFILMAERSIGSVTFQQLRKTELTVEELAKAENFWLLTVQREAFEKELAALQSGKNPEGKLARFNPYLDENGLPRVGGRLQNSDMDAERKHPILLPSTHPVVMLLIKRVHERSLHAGTEQTLTDLRQRFWVLKDRVTVAAPFERIGIDFAGPVYIKMKGKQEPHVGDIVLVSEDDVPTHMWPMARVIEVYPGSDGVVRTVKVKTLKGTYHRSVRKLRLLEPAVDADGLRPSRGESLLEGEGLKAIDGYAVTQDNYPIARQALVSRFGNPKRVIEHHIQAIADLRPNRDRTLRELHDELVTHVRSLRALNRDTLGNQFASDIILTLCKRLLPKKIISLWEDKILESEEDPNEVETFFVFLHKHAEIEARLQQGPFHECSAGKPLLLLPRESPCRRMSLVFKGDETGKNVTSVGLHRLLSEDRNVREAEENCTSHGDERSEKSPETTPTDVSEPPNAVRVCGNRTKDTRDRTYLQTAKAYLYAPNVNGCAYPHWETTPVTRSYEVSFSLKGITSNSQAKQINAYCVNRICDTLEENPPIMWEHVKDLNLADDFPRDRCDVDVLIGIDYYYHFLEDDRRRVVDEWLVALRSTLGWILCGQDSRTNYTDTVKVMRIDVEQRCDCGKHRRFGELEWITIMDQPETESPAERNYILLSCDDESTAQKIVCWSDSEVALSWIKSPAVKWKTFVRNRFESIQQLTEASVWCHCPTGENPADMLSRG